MFSFVFLRREAYHYLEAKFYIVSHFFLTILCGCVKMKKGVHIVVPSSQEKTTGSEFSSNILHYDTPMHHIC